MTVGHSARREERGRAKLARVGLFSIGVIAGAACSDHKNPKANLNCGDQPCLKNPPKGEGGAAGTDGGTTTDGSTSDVIVDAPGGVTVSGTVKQFQGDDFSLVIPFGDPATIRFDGATGAPVEGSYGGTTFSVAGVLPSVSAWATVMPTAGTALATIEPIDTQSGLDVELHVVPAATIDLIYGLISIPQDRDPAAGYVVLKFVDDVKFEPIAGVTVTHAGEAVAYDAGGTWSDSDLGSGDQGFAVVVNVPTTKVPAKQIFQYSSPTASGGVEVLVAPKTATIAQVPLKQ